MIKLNPVLSIPYINWYNLYMGINVNGERTQINRVIYGSSLGVYVR